MAQAILGSIPLTNSWVDIVATYGAAASVDLILQNRGTSNIEYISTSSAVAPAASDIGMLIEPNQSGYANAAHIWVRGWRSSTVLVTTI